MWIWIVGGGLLALLVIVPVVGYALPERYRSKGRVDVPLSPAEVWARLADYERYPMSSSMCRGVEPGAGEEGLPAWTEDIGSSRLHYRTELAQEPTRLVRTATDSVVPMSARWEIELEPLDGGTRVWVSVDVTVRRGTWCVPLFRLLLTFTRGHERGVEQFLKTLGEPFQGVSWEEVAASSG